MVNHLFQFIQGAPLSIHLVQNEAIGTFENMDRTPLGNPTQNNQCHHQPVQTRPCPDPKQQKYIMQTACPEGPPSILMPHPSLP